ncbi:MAG TPA: cupin domain-containing protein [Gammaproteobacteria bacterium]
MDAVAAKLAERLGLEPHPEGGFYKEIYRSPLEIPHPAVPGGESAARSAGTLIYYLLAGEQFSAFHRLRWTDEIWHLYAGGPLELHLIDSDGDYERRLLTGDLARGEPAAVVPAGVWQAARLESTASWALCGCMVAPGFDFADFEIPPRSRLLAAHPQHAAVIRELTRS